jgi:hypothetical protein
VPTAKDPTVLMSVVAPDEPEGYRGRRRHLRFPFVGKAGGAAVPALLVAASVVVVLIVVGVSQLLPKQAAGQIPFGSAPGAAANDNGQSANDPGTGTDNGPSGASSGGSTKPGKSPGAKPSGSSSPGTGPGGTPTDPGTPTQTPTQTPTTPPATFTPVSVEAESASLGGVAKTGTCTGCQGSKVRFLGTNTGWVTFNGINAPSAMTVQLTFWYIAATTPRTFYISVNGGAAIQSTPAATVDWNTPKSTTIPISVASGANSIKFYNPNSTANAPDLDRISIR